MYDKLLENNDVFLFKIFREGRKGKSIEKNIKENKNNKVGYKRNINI